MKFEKFLLEGNTSGRTKVIEEEEAVKFIATRCKQALRMYREGRIIYRSSEQFTKPWGIVEPARFKRTSRYTRNYYTTMIDNMEQWSKYPKRSKSLIGASDSRRADNHVGKTYMMFPVDGTVLGVCPRDDLWDSFRGLQADSFNTVLGAAFKSYLNEKPSGDWSELQAQMKRFDSVYDDEENNRFFNSFYRGDMYQACADYLDPVSNDFRIKKIGDVLPENKEVWWSTKTVLVENSASMEGVLDEIV